MQELSGALGHTFVRSVKRALTSTAETVHGGRRLKPYEIAAHIFDHLKAGGSAHPTLHGHKFKSCVVTVPVGFSGEQRREIRRAMEKAGLELQGFVHEPFAAMVSHFYHPDTRLSALRGKRVLVFDWGGGTLDVCLVEGSADGSTLFELAHDGIADHAGDDFDRRIMADLRGRFLTNHPTLTNDDIDTRCRANDRFWINAELGKIELSKDETSESAFPTSSMEIRRSILEKREMARGEFFTFLERGEPLSASASKKFIFYCTDPRDGTANFVFCKKPVSGDSTAVVPTGSILQAPVVTERPSHYRDLDRLIVRAAVTEDATLLIDVQHTGTGNRAQLEISDVSFGLQLTQP